jgi:hypothetical protein
LIPWAALEYLYHTVSTYDVDSIGGTYGRSVDTFDAVEPLGAIVRATISGIEAGEYSVTPRRAIRHNILELRARVLASSRVNPIVGLQMARSDSLTQGRTRLLAHTGTRFLAQIHEVTLVLIASIGVVAKPD